MSWSPLMHGIAGLSGRPAKPRVFVSYHHDNDQCYADRFTRLFDSSYDVLTDRSLREPIKSADPDYTYQRLRDDFISGSSCTIVLCGSETCNRKYVDWEIKATLDKHHGLLGLLLPTHRPSFDGSYVVPNRLYDNIQSGYAHWMSWTDNVHLMVIGINAALERAKNTRLIVNSRSMMGRNR